MTMIMQAMMTMLISQDDYDNYNNMMKIMIIMQIMTDFFTRKELEDDQVIAVQCVSRG